MKRIKGRKRQFVPQIITCYSHERIRRILSMPCEEVKPDEDVSAITRGMVQALKQTKTGVGLAAPQIGILKKIIVFTLRNGVFQIMINPELESYSGGLVSYKEGCLSYPGKFKVISRSKEINVTYEDASRKRQEDVFYTGMEARIIQHELDHLEGVCKVGSQA